MSSKILVSPSDYTLLENLGDDAISSPIPELKGADVLIYSEKGLIGLQRKKVPGDFIDSFTDGRFARLLPLLTTSCTYYRVVLEGRFKYWPDTSVHLGMMKDGKRIPCRFNRSHIHGMLNDLEFVWGIQIRWTEDVDDTIRYIKSIQRFTSPDKHTGTFRRPKARGNWGTPTSKDIELWVLQSFPGIGPSTADRIIKYFSRVPLRWTCTAEELAKAGRINISRARELIDCLEYRFTRSDIANSSKAVENQSMVVENQFDKLRRMIGRH